MYCWVLSGPAPTAVFTGIKNAGDLRDTIVLGKIATDVLPVPYLKRLLWVEWLPLKLSLALISLVLAIIILLLPTIVGPSKDSNIAAFRTICWVAAAMPLVGCMYQLVACVIEWRFLLKTVEGRR